VETRLLLASPQLASQGTDLAEASPALKAGLEELGQYLQGLRHEFTVKLRFQGPPFYQQVWRTLMAVPYGQTLSYGDLAAAAGSPGGARAVGSAMRRNHLVLLVPCHRVVGSGGKLGGFSSGVEWKKFLLNLEQSRA
jgi:methylated-DNA-[protein]-cysteine S-methyltransferase